MPEISGGCLETARSQTGNQLVLFAIAFGVVWAPSAKDRKWCHGLHVRLSQTQSPSPERGHGSYNSMHDDDVGAIVEYS